MITRFRFEKMDNDREMEIIEKLVEAITEDLHGFYDELTGRTETKIEDSFYWHVIPSNPKFYPISGFQHYIGTGILAARLSSFLGRSEYETVVSFLSGVLHDFNKWGMSLEEMKKNVYEKLEVTAVYNKIVDFLGAEKAKRAFTESLDISLKLESGGVPRELQAISEIVRVADKITGGRESWSLSYNINSLLSSGLIKASEILPVAIGKQRPIVSLISGKIVEELESQEATPLISTPEGMIFLTRKSVDASRVYKAITEYIASTMEENEPEVKEGRKPKINIEAMRRFIHDESRKLSSLSRTYRAISYYKPEDIVNSYKEYVGRGFEDLRVYIVTLANIYRKDPQENEIERLERFISELQLPAEKIIEERTMEDMLRKLYRMLLNVDNETLKKMAEKATSFIISEMSRYRKINPELLSEKLSMYISIGLRTEGKEKQLEKIEREKTEICSICREPIAIEEPKPLTSFLQELANIIKGINTSEVFHPDIQGRPEKEGSIADAKYAPVCEVCYSEAISIPRKIGCMDGQWVSVLQYYPAIPVDVLDIIGRVIHIITGEEVRQSRKTESISVITDYMTSRIITNCGDFLDSRYLRRSLDLWFLLGGNLLVTTTPLSSAFVGSSLPVELEITDVIVEETVSEYMDILEKAKRDEKYLKFTRVIRYWLYKTLRDYVDNLESKRTGAKASNVLFSRSMLNATGIPTIDVYSFILKQSKKA